MQVYGYPAGMAPALPSSVDLAYGKPASIYPAGFNNFEVGMSVGGKATDGMVHTTMSEQIAGTMCAHSALPLVDLPYW